MDNYSSVIIFEIIPWYVQSYKLYLNILIIMII